MNQGELAVWAWSRPKAGNFGDELGPEILARLGYLVRRTGLKDADLIGCGSVLEYVAGQARPGTVIWGAGLQRGQACDVSGLDVRAVRGRLTSATLDLDNEVLLGDPALLVPHLWNRPRVRHRIGVVRHYTDTRTFPWADTTIDTGITSTRSVDVVIQQIGSCAAIASSSLHGLLVAMAWGIPAMRLSWDKVVGGNFKFADAVSGIPATVARPEDLIGALP